MNPHLREELLVKIALSVARLKGENPGKFLQAADVMPWLKRPEEEDAEPTLDQFARKLQAIVRGGK